MIAPLVRRRWELRAVLAVLAAAGVGLAPAAAIGEDGKPVAVAAALDDEQRETKLSGLLARSREAFAQGDNETALKLADQATALAPDEPRAFAFRASINTALRKHEAARRDYDRLVELKPNDPNVRDQRGAANFCSGRIAESVADFDKAVELDSARGPGHWRRGISYYFAEQYDEGVKQFEGYQTVDDSDVENAVWRFLCMARRDGFEKARAGILKIGDDRRVPMRAIYNLFAGQGTEAEVLAACRSGEPSEAQLNERLFYAEQYLGLFAEARGDQKTACEHMERAVSHPIPHYMYEVAAVHLERLKSTPDKPAGN